MNLAALYPLGAPPSALTTRALFERLGEVALSRICFDPFPGTGTEQDILEIHARTDRLFELVDGILVEKGMGFTESCIGVTLACRIMDWTHPRNLGPVLGAGGPYRLWPGLVRIPDVSFVFWDRFPGRRIDPHIPIPDLFPDLAVEVINLENTASELAVKRQEYFKSGTQLVWEVDIRVLTVEVFTAPATSTVLQKTDTLDGGSVLPGFALPLAQLFAKLDPH